MHKDFIFRIKMFKLRVSSVVLNSIDAVVPATKWTVEQWSHNYSTNKSWMFLLLLRLQMQRILTENPDVYTWSTYTKEILSTRSSTLTLIVFSSLQLKEFTLKRVQPSKKKVVVQFAHVKNWRPLFSTWCIQDPFKKKILKGDLHLKIRYTFAKVPKLIWFFF